MSHEKVYKINSRFQWGINACHLPNQILTSKDLELIKENEIDYLGIDFIWKKIVPYPRKFDFRYYDWLLYEADRLGLKVLGRLGNGYNGIYEERQLVPRWVNEKNYIKELKSYIETTVARYKKKVNYWIIENELNLVGMHKRRGWRSGDWSDEKIHKILKTSAEVVKSTDPEAKIIVSAGLVPNWVTYLDRVTREWKVEYDVVGLQAYPFAFLQYERILPLTKRIPLKWFRDIVASYMKYNCEIAKRFRPQVIFTEMGFSTIDGQESRQVEALKYGIQAVIDSGADGVYWYAYKDDLTDFPEIERYFGLLTADGKPKPAWYEYGKIIKKSKLMKTFKSLYPSSKS